jgi:hypothetical protein
MTIVNCCLIFMANKTGNIVCVDYMVRTSHPA